MARRGWRSISATSTSSATSAAVAIASLIGKAPADLSAARLSFVVTEGVLLAGSAPAPACRESAGRRDVIVRGLRGTPPIGALRDLDAQDAAADRCSDFCSREETPPFLAHPQSQRGSLVEADARDVVGDIGPR